MTINLERKRKEQTNGRTNRRMPICNPTIQLVVVDLYTKYEVSILNSCGDIFDKKVLRNYGRRDRRMDRRTDGTTDRCKPVYPPLFPSGGINRRMPICNPTIQLVSANLHIKFEISILNGCGDIFDEKSGQKKEQI